VKRFAAMPPVRGGSGGRPGDQVNPGGGLDAAPADSAEAVAYFFAFFALHFWTDVELRVEPSAKVSVAVWDHFFFLHRAMT
jgi:hypothetical protein